MSEKSTLTKVEIRYLPSAQIGKLFMKAQVGDPAAFLPVSELDLIDMPGMEASRRAITHPKNLETIYRHYQRIDDTPDERCTQLKVRSMSVGDAIVVKGRAYYVVSDGFAFKDDEGTLVPVTPENS